MNKKMKRNCWLAIVVAVLLGIVGVGKGDFAVQSVVRVAEPCYPTPQDIPEEGQDAMSIHL